jgi:hypothetical protein
VTGVQTCALPIYRFIQIIIIIVVIAANIEKPVAFQPEWLMNLEVQANSSHAVYDKGVVI